MPQLKIGGDEGSRTPVFSSSGLHLLSHAYFVLIAQMFLDKQKESNEQQWIVVIIL